LELVATVNKALASLKLAKYNFSLRREGVYSMNQAIGSRMQQVRRYVERLAAFVLLAGIAYSVTFGTLHSHADPSERPSARQTTHFTETAIVEAGTAGNAGTSEQDCLICQFHQQLFNSVVHARITLAGLTAESSQAAVGVSFEYSQQFASSPIERHSGRAPPLA